MRASTITFLAAAAAMAASANASCSHYTYNPTSNGGSVKIGPYGDSESCSSSYPISCSSATCNVFFRFSVFNTESKYDKLTLSVGGNPLPGSPFSGDKGTFVAVYGGAKDGDEVTVSFASDGSNHDYPGVEFTFDTEPMSTVVATDKILFDTFFSPGDEQVEVDITQVQWNHQERQCSMMTSCGPWAPVRETAPCGVKDQSNANYKMMLTLNDVLYSAPNRWSSSARISRQINAKCGCSKEQTLYDFKDSSQLSPDEFSVIRSCKLAQFSNIPTYPNVKDVTNQPVGITIYGDRIEFHAAGAYKILDSKGERTLTYEVQSSLVMNFGAFRAISTRVARDLGYNPSAVWTPCSEPSISVRDTIAQWFVPGSAEVAVPFENPLFASRIRRCSTAFGCDSWAETDAAKGKGFGATPLRAYLEAYDNVLSLKIQAGCTTSKFGDLFNYGPVAFTDPGPKNVPAPTVFSSSSCNPTDFYAAWAGLEKTKYFGSSTYSTSATRLPSEGSPDPSTVSFTATFTKHCARVVSDVVTFTPSTNNFPFEYYEAQIAWGGDMVDDSQKIIKASVDNVAPADGEVSNKPASSAARLAAIVAGAAAVAAVAIFAAAVVVRRRRSAAAAAASADMDGNNLVVNLVIDTDDAVEA